MSTTAEWLASLGMSEYADRFAENGIDVSVLRHVTDQDLKDIGVLLGHRRKMLAAIGELAAPASPEPGDVTAPPPQDSAERRLADRKLTRGRAIWRCVYAGVLLIVTTLVMLKAHKETLETYSGDFDSALQGIAPFSFLSVTYHHYFNRQCPIWGIITQTKEEGKECAKQSYHDSKEYLKQVTLLGGILAGVSVVLFTALAIFAEEMYRAKTGKVFNIPNPIGPILFLVGVSLITYVLDWTLLGLNGLLGLGLGFVCWCNGVVVAGMEVALHGRHLRESAYEFIRASKEARDVLKS
jgi:hypothetical protein